MSGYRGTADGPEQAKAIVAVAAIHALLALLILLGLSGQRVQQRDEALTTITIKDPIRQPPIPNTTPRALRKTARKPSAAAAAKAISGPAVSPAHPIVPAQPSTATLPVTSPPLSGGTAAGSGGFAGRGTGVGGGNGRDGAGGDGDYSRFTPARLVANIPNSEYHELAASGLASGVVGVVILVSPTGSVSNCRVARSSSDPSIDALVCALTLRWVRFDPARDSHGRPVAQDVTYFPGWRRR